MKNSHRTTQPIEGAFGPEPSRDIQLGALLRSTTGSVPDGAVDWASLADRISVAVARQAASPWWSYATGWERRILPLALAAGIAAGFALWNVTATNTTQLATAHSLVTEVASGTPADDAASTFAHSITSSEAVTAGVPE